MTAAVVDTNVLASGFVAQHGSSQPAQVLDAWRARAYILAVLLRARALLTPITAHVHGVATHPEDDLVLATTLSSGQTTW